MSDSTNYSQIFGIFIHSAPISPILENLGRALYNKCAQKGDLFPKGVKEEKTLFRPFMYILEGYFYGNKSHFRTGEL